MPNRREFIGMSCAGLGLLASFDLKALAASAGAADLTLAEWQAKGLEAGFWSADSLLFGAIKYLKKPDEYISLATGFGGGIGRKDLCGYVTGGVMAVGLFSGLTDASDKEKRQKCARLTKEYVDWWEKSYSLHCGDIKQPCNYPDMGAKAAAFLQSLFERESAKS